MGNLDDVQKYEGEPKVVLSELRLLSKLGKDVPAPATMMNRIKRREGGFEAKYLILAKGIVDVDYEGVVVDFINDSSGKNYAKDAQGNKKWLSSYGFGKVNREAGFAEFVLRGSGNVWEKEIPKIKGKVTITVADKMKTQEISGKVTAGKIGAYTVKIEKSFMGDAKVLAVTSDTKDGIGEISVFCGGKSLEGNGSMTMNGVKKYMFKRPASDDIVIKVTSPDGEKKIVLPF